MQVPRLRGVVSSMSSLFLALAVLVAACVPPPPAPPAAPGVGEGMAGQRFHSAMVSTFGLNYPLQGETGLVLEFSPEGDRFTATAGCSTADGSVQGSGDRLLMEIETTTDRACDPLQAAQDAWVLAFLSADPTFLLQGPYLFLQVGWTAIILLN